MAFSPAGHALKGLPFRELSGEASLGSADVASGDPHQPRARDSVSQP
jgi:hypothetical protein